MGLGPAILLKLADSAHFAMDTDRTLVSPSFETEPPMFAESVRYSGQRACGEQRRHPSE